MAYTYTQQMFCLSALTDLVGYFSGDATTLTQQAEALIQSILQDDESSGLIGDWEVVWGPVAWPEQTVMVLRFDGPLAQMFQSQYVVALSGSQSTHWKQWLSHDDSLQVQEPWPYLPQAYGGDLEPQIASGLGRCLQCVLHDMKPHHLQPGAELSLVELMTTMATELPEPASITVAGHGLGGTLAAGIGLALQDLQVEGPNGAGWDPKQQCRIATYLSGNPTPGNADFAYYFESVLGASSQRLWNKLDVVPYAWQTDAIMLSSFLYAPYIAPNDFIQILTGFSLEKVKMLEDPYCQLLPHTPPLPGQLNHTLLDGLKIENRLGEEDMKLLTGVTAQIFAAYKPKPSQQELPFGRINPEELAQTVQSLLIPWLGDPTGEQLRNTMSALHADMQELLNELWEEIEKLLLYLIQLIYQHTEAYHHLLGTRDFARLLRRHLIKVRSN
ncbi:MAG TPA: hypothetical protein DCR93_14900 [Cytophagales bacterium]|nr:hypothetical protein [Cytophagales bacterium]